MTQAIIDVPKDRIDQVLEFISLLAMIGLVILSIYFYNQLPEEIPNHFNVHGEADGYGHKGSIFMLPVIGLLILILFGTIEKYPHTFNYRKKITKENAFTQYKLSLRLLRSLRMIIHVGFLIMLWFQIQMAIGKLTQMPRFLAVAFVCIIISTIGNYIYRANKTN